MEFTSKEVQPELKRIDDAAWLLNSVPFS